MDYFASLAMTAQRKKRANSRALQMILAPNDVA
jgi:hypothetical protein